MKKLAFICSVLFIAYGLTSCELQEGEVHEGTDVFSEKSSDLEFLEESDPNARVMIDHSNVFDFETEEMIPNAFSKLMRKDDGVAAVIHTSQLESKGVYTIWAVIFENPEFCSDGMCGLDDIFDAEGELLVNDDGTFGTPDVNVTVMWATGKIASTSGIGTFNFKIMVNNPHGEVLFGPGLTDAMNSEIHFVVRTHGQAILGLLEEQLTTFAGGCDINACADEQFSIHKF